ncbi:interferon alpha/beta receptor 2 isoform X1 [Phyllostomus hastatus]|uniref:interferon alpha/beta receptor 2 isoform X1 n=1 Tax=Phyllostomus hastatus TaxID=9423 RepID=UPI001E682B5F|nr:interferon alpha/beta receptor 2 isoform X1 [Phyllostomus hastatus]
MTRMLWGHDACAGRPLALCLLGSICLMSGAPQPLPELSDGPCDINMVLRNFRPVISWKLRSVSIAPTHYTLWYANMSDRKDMEVVEHCANITSLSCDVTDLWADVSEMYELQLVGSRGNATAVQCFRNIFPELDMRLEPPEFEVAGFTDHIRVTLLLPETLPKGPQDQELWSHFPLIIEEQLEGIAKKHKLKINEDTKGNFTYILDKLIPNTTYCVSVYFNPRNVENVIRSPQKCTHLPPARQSVSPESAIIGAFMSVAFVVAVAVSALMTLRRVGYICLRSVPPKVLDFRNSPSWAFPERPPVEAVAVLEVIHVNRKKKVWNYDYDDESDGEETVVQACAGGYTMNGLAIRPVCPASGSSARLEGYSSPDAQEDAPSEPEDETRSLLTEPRPRCAECAGGASEGQRAPPVGPAFKEDSSSTKSSADRNFFNVDLNSVFVRVLDDSDPEVPPVPSLADETVDPEDPDETGTSLAVANAQGTQQCFPGHPGQGLWLEDSSSSSSDTSESDVDVGTGVSAGDGYLMR